MLWKAEPSGHFVGHREQGLGAVLFGNKVYFSIGSLTPCRVRDETLAKVSPGPEELCAHGEKAKAV